MLGDTVKSAVAAINSLAHLDDAAMEDDEFEKNQKLKISSTRSEFVNAAKNRLDADKKAFEKAEEERIVAERIVYDKNLAMKSLGERLRKAEEEAEIANEEEVSCPDIF